MENIEIIVKKIIPKEGFLLTDGEVTTDVLFVKDIPAEGTWWEIPDPDYVEPEGAYINPILIPENGLTTQIGLWYYVDDKDLPHEAITEAFVIPKDFNDKQWFDFV